MMKSPVLAGGAHEAHMTVTTALPLPTVSPEVQAFAAEKGVDSYLPQVVGLVRRLFPLAPTQIHVAGDPELADNWEIVFEVRTNGLPEEELERLQQQWTRELFELCPASHVHLFCLSLRHAP
jgi:hypothetical protein